MRRTLASAAVAALVLGLVAATPSTASAAPADTLSVAFTAPQDLAGVDPRRATVAVTFTAADCSRGCRVVRVGRLRANETEVLIGSKTFPAQATPRSVTFTDVVEGEPGWSLDWHYALSRPGSETYADADLQVEPETAARYSGGWRRDLNTTTTETMIMRSANRGATATFGATPNLRRVGVVSARGPQNGVMVVKVGGAVAHTVDLRAATWQPRRVVAAVDVPAGAVLQVVNATPAARPAKDVHVDGLVVLDGGNPFALGASARELESQGRTAAAAAPETLTVTPVVPQQLPARGGPVLVDVVAKVYGCPAGCQVVQTSYDGAGGTTVLLDKRLPTTPTLQTLSVRVPAPQNFIMSLDKGGQRVIWGTNHYTEVLADSSLEYSSGVSRVADAASTNGTLMRSTAAGTGATYRVTGVFSGRPVALVAAKGPRGGVAAIHVDGKLVRTVDLQATTAQPRQVVAALQLPLAGRVTVVNRTPAGRAASQLDIDGLVRLDDLDDWY